MDAPSVKKKCLAEMAEIFPGRIIWAEDMMKFSISPDEVTHAG